MSIFLDLIGSLFVRGSMIAVMVAVTVTMNDALYERSQQANTKEHLSVVQDIMHQDLTQAGYNATRPAFSIAAQKDVRFRGDIDNDGTAETIRYYGVFNSTTNMWKLYRTENSGTPLEIGRNFTGITFQYYGSKGRITPYLDSIKVVRVNLIARIEGVSKGFTAAIKEFKVYPPNL